MEFTEYMETMVVENAYRKTMKKLANFGGGSIKNSVFNGANKIKPPTKINFTPPKIDIKSLSKDTGTLAPNKLMDSGLPSVGPVKMPITTDNKLTLKDIDGLKIQKP